MARITSKDALITYITEQLGAPTINIEVTNAQMGQIIDDTVQKFTEYAYGTLEDTVILQLAGPGDYQLPDSITNVIKMSKGGGSNILNFNVNFGGYVPDIWSEQFFTQSGSLMGDLVPTIVSVSNLKAQLDKFFGDDLYYNFNHLAKKIQLLENFSGPVVLHYEYEYLANEANDLVYNHEWIKAYSLNKVKMLWGNVVGKFDQSLVGGARINYDRIINEAQEALLKLDEELLTKWSDPAPVSIA